LFRRRGHVLSITKLDWAAFWAILMAIGRFCHKTTGHRAGRRRFKFSKIGMDMRSVYISTFSILMHTWNLLRRQISTHLSNIAEENTRHILRNLGSMLRSQFSAVCANLWRKNWRFSQKPMFWSNFCKTSSSLSKKRQYFC
jgi:hypothetical protein